MTKKLLIALAIFGVVLFAGMTVKAQEANFHNDLVKKIAEKFNLQESEVKTVFEDFHQEKMAKHQQMMEDKLTQAVKDGKLTEAQKQAILKKHQEMKANHQSLKNLTPEERREKMQSHKQEMEAWAKENGLTLETFHEVMGKGPGFKMKMHFRNN